MSSRESYRLKARNVVMDMREQNEVTYAELARRLTEEDGIKIETQALINRIHRGNFSLSFTLRLMNAMKVDGLYPPHERPDDFATPE